MYNMELDGLYDVEKKITVRIIQEDMESIHSLMSSERDPIFCMAIIPYYALFVQACQEYMGETYIPESEARRIKDIRNHIKAYGEKFGKSKRRIKEIDCKQDDQFRSRLKFDFMKNMNMHLNLGTYWTEDRHIIGNTQMFADFLDIEDVFERERGKRQYELSYQLGSFVALVKSAFSNCIYQPVVDRKKYSIKIGYFFDLNTNKDSNFFIDGSSKELNIFLLHLTCNMNFVKYILRMLFKDGNKWLFRVEYVVTYYTYRALCRLKNYCENNDDIKMDFNECSEIFCKGDILFQSKFRNCMMHYGLENKGVLSFAHIEKPFFGMIETCFNGMDYQTYVNNLRELSNMIIVFLEKRFDANKIRLRRL